MKKTIVIALSLFLLCGYSTPSAALWGKDFHVAVKIEYDSLIGGGAGKFESPDYRLTPSLLAAYGSGFGGRVELGYIYDVNYEILLGAGYLTFPGGSERIVAMNGDVIDFELGDYEGVPIYIGGRFLFSDDPTSGFFPYVRVDAGVIWIQPINASIHFISSDPALLPATVNTKWWDGTAIFMWDLGGGFEYRFGKFGLFGEFLYQNLGEPDSAVSSNIYTTTISADGTKWQPFSGRAGFSYYF